MITHADLTAAKKKLQAQLRKLKAAEKGVLLPGDHGAAESSISHRDASAEHERKKSHASRLVEFEVTSTSLRRRKIQERDIVRWLRYYFADVFTRPLTEQQIQMAHAILHAAAHGGDQAIAAPRGEGKTTITECVVVYCVLTNLLAFPLILAATGPDAERILANIKGHFEDNERLHEDYNEVCAPIHALEGLPNRANGQLVQGKIGTEEIPECRSRIKWAGHRVQLPTIPGKYSRASGAIIATRGLDAAVRGVKYGTRRPDLAVIDDPETRELAESQDDRLRDKLERKIDQDVAGTAGHAKRLARVMLTTLMTRDCTSAKFTDPEQKPSWHGVRMKMVEQWPTHAEMWEEYLSRRQAGQHAGDKFCRDAHAYYMEHRALMDEGAVVANPYRFVGDKLPDGTRHQLSTLQFVYDWIGDHSREAFDTEYQNDPPEDTGITESGITAHHIQMQVSGYPLHVVPPGCTVLTQGIDVGKTRLHWVVRAWRPDATGYVIDYGVTDVTGTVVGTDEGTDRQIARAIRARMSDCVDGNPYGAPIDLTLVDARYRRDAIYAICKEIGLGIFPAMGFGSSMGCIKRSYLSPLKRKPGLILGDGWHRQKQPAGVHLVCMDTDRWKAWEHDRWMTSPEKPGTLFMWGMGERHGRPSADQKSHTSYAHHITCEVEVEEIIKGALVRHWKPKRANNHWLDASYMSDVAANIMGIRLINAQTPQAQEGDTKTLAEMAAEASHG